MNSIVQPLSVSILTAPVAAIDRRALSQAWYSALHVTLRGGGSKVSVVAPSSSSRSRAMVWREPPGAQVARRAKPCALRANRSLVKPGVVAMPERRATRLTLARKIEQAFSNRRLSVRRATFDVGDAAGTRVHVVLQTSGFRVRLVAFCAPSALQTVSRALEQARFALAARGVAVQDIRIEETAC